MIVLTRIDPSQNLRRFYIVSVTRTLLGEWSLMRERGRIGSPGTVRCRSFVRGQVEQKFGQRSIKRRLRHGYEVR